MKCPWQTVEDTYRYSDMCRLNGYGIKKEITFGDCIKDCCPFYDEDNGCNRAGGGIEQLHYESNPKEGTAEEEPHWIKQVFSDGGYNYLCTSCNETSIGDNSKYCPNCGKKMSDVVYRKHVDAEAPFIDIDDENLKEENTNG